MPGRPNVLWITFEDTSPRFGCYGDDLARTPNVDRLAAEGRVYERAFATAPVCAPCRSAAITGCYQTWLGTQHQRTTHANRATPELPTPYEAVPPPQVKLLGEYLRAAGYYCTNNHKTDYQFQPPCTAWDDCSRTAHWRGRAPGQPFFAVWNLGATHESGQWPVEGEDLQTDPDRVRLPPYLPDGEACRRALARQYDRIALHDGSVGGLLRELEEDGVADDTLVVIWSDHGEGLPRCKRWCYDGGIRVPLIVRWPGRVAPGSRDPRLVSMVDLAPATLRAAGLAVPRHMHGVPFLDDDAPERDHVFACRDRFDESYDRVRAVRDRRFKYVRNDRPELPRALWIPYRNRHPIVEELYRRQLAGTLTDEQAWFAAERRPVEELYDCETDPHELRNLAGDPAHRAELERLRAACDAWCERYDRFAAWSEAQMVEHFWPGRVQPATAAPRFVPISEAGFGVEVADPRAGPVRLPDPAMVQLHCPTEGASMAWRRAGERAWRLYTGPVRLAPGAVTLEAKAIRIGYAESHEVAAIFEVG